MLHMQFLEHGRPAPHVLDMDDRSPAHVEGWILVELLHRGVDRERFSKALPFEVQNAMWGDHEKFSTADYEAEIAALSQWLVAGADGGEVAPGMAITVPASDAVPLRAHDIETRGRHAANHGRSSSRRAMARRRSLSSR